MLTFFGRKYRNRGRVNGQRKVTARPRLNQLENRVVPSIDLGPIVNPTNGHTYYRLTQSNWSVAENEAISLGGHLATINDSAENEWVVSAFGSPTEAWRMWIGLNRLNQGNVYSWASGEPVTYTDWAPNQPSFTGNGFEHCVEVHSVAGGFGRWNDLPNSATAGNIAGGTPMKGIVEVNVQPSDIHMLSAQLKTGNTVQFTYETSGNPGPFDVGLYRSADGMSYSSGDLIDTKTITPNPTNPQSPGSITVPFPWTSDPAKPFVIAVADHASKIQESDENNNTASVRLPDLVATSLALNTTTGGVDFGYDINGSNLSLTTNAALYWATGPNYSDRIGGPFSTMLFAQIGSYGPVHVEQASLNAAPVGATHLLVRVDDFASVFEADEANNLRSLPLSNLRIIQATTDDSRQVRFNYEVIGASVGQFEVKLFRSARQNFTPETFDPAQDKEIGPVPLFTNSGPGIFAGVIASNATFKPLDIDAKHPYVFVVADPDKLLVETNETDNSKSFEKRVLGIVTHGFTLLGPINFGFPAWITDMAAALKNNQGYDRTVAFNWTQYSWRPIPGMTQLAGSLLASRVQSEVMQLKATYPDSIIDLHMIGHSRGAVVISQALQNLQSNVVVGGMIQQGFTKMTMLDPHPARNTVPQSFSVMPGRPGLIAGLVVTLIQGLMQDPEPFFPRETDQPELYFQQSPWLLSGSLLPINLWGMSSVLNLSGQQTLTSNLNGTLFQFQGGYQIVNHVTITDWYMVEIVPGL